MPQLRARRRRHDRLFEYRHRVPAGRDRVHVAPQPQQPPAAEASIHAYGDRDKTCQAWTDKCRSCERGDGDAIHCSNIGIACQPAEITCSRRSEPAK